MRTEGLHLEQAPPLAIPLSFFATAPFAALTAGVTLLVVGSPVLASGWSPLTLSLTHLGTLGFLTMVMMGALYQMSPVVAASPVPWVRSAHGVHALMLAAVVALCAGLASGSAWAVFAAIGLAGPALLLFLIPVGVALYRAPARNTTVIGMSTALVALLLTGTTGLWMAHGHGGMRFPGPRPLWIEVHLCVALLGWVGGLLTSVSWQVLPLFYLAREPDPRIKAACQGLIALGVLGPIAVLTFEYTGALDTLAVRPERLAALAALPALLAVWGIHPAVCLRALAGRRRRRADGSLLFWRAGLAIGLAIGAVAIAAHLSPDPRWSLLFGWLALWGWAGMIVHGMLTRIVPFLVWLHRFAPLIGQVRVPSIRTLLPDAHVRLGFALHLASVVTGAAAILTTWPPLTRATGLLVIATALQLGRAVLGLALTRPRV
jgi:hypothetical protein